MDIDQGRLQGLVSHEIFDGKQVGPVFIKVSSKGMPERMAGEPVFPAEKFFMDGKGPSVSGKPSRRDGRMQTSSG